MEVKKSLNILTENKDDMQIQREIDLLKFQINEIESANLNKDEYEELLKQREVYRNSEKIYSNLNSSYQQLYEGSVNAVDLIGNAVRELRTVKMSVLKDIAKTLIDIHGQHQTQALFNKDTHLEFLDLFGEH